MTDNIENLVLEHLRAMRGGIEQIQQDVRDVKMRLTSIESGLSSNRRETLNTQDDVYRQQSVLDQLRERIDRIEKRLDISTAH